MSRTKEIKNHIKSVKDTQKITNAMYLISSTKMRKAKSDRDKARPYFKAVQQEIKRIFRVDENIDNKYFYPASGEHELPGSYGYLVITADKGLAGAYNQNVIKEALRLMQEHENPKLYVVGEYGRHYFNAHNIPIEKSFLYTAQNPSIQRARDIADILMDMYNNGKLAKIFIIYTDMKNAAVCEAKSTRLLPFHRAQFIIENSTEEKVKTPFEFVPSIESVLNNIVPSYITGFIYAALTDSFCSEQNARMSAMDAANRNAEKLLSELSVEYNHVRQSAITQEITEISSGAKSMKNKK